MPERAARGDWVEIHSIALEPDGRSPDVPEDTRNVPLELRVKGAVQTDAAVGDEVEVVTSSGRRLRGTLTDPRPAYTHGFGPPVEALLDVGRVARELLANEGGDEGDSRD